MHIIVSMRLQLIEFLGGKCASPTCAWINENGSRGCTDLRCLQVDHKEGGGKQAFKDSGGTYNHYKFWLDNPDLAKKELQNLCANCNWIKRHEKNENRKFADRKASDSTRSKMAKARTKWWTPERREHLSENNPMERPEVQTKMDVIRRKSRKPKVKDSHLAIARAVLLDGVSFRQAAVQNGYAASFADQGPTIARRVSKALNLAFEQVLAYENR